MKLNSMLNISLYIYMALKILLIVILSSFVLYLYLGAKDENTGFKGVSFAILISVSISTCFLVLNPEPEYFGMIPAEAIILAISIIMYDIISIDISSKYIINTEEKLFHYANPNRASWILEKYQNLTNKKFEYNNGTEDLVNLPENFEDFSAFTDAPVGIPDAFNQPTPSISYFVFLVLVYVSELCIILQMLTLAAVLSYEVIHLTIKITALEERSRSSLTVGIESLSLEDEVFHSESEPLIPVPSSSCDNS